MIAALRADRRRAVLELARILARRADWRTMTTWRPRARAVTGSWEEVTLAEGTRALVIRPDRVAVWSAVLISAAPAVVPAARALQLLDHRARSRELGDWVGSTLDLMRRMDLPREWWWSNWAR